LMLLFHCPQPTAYLPDLKGGFLYCFAEGWACDQGKKE